jgi:RNA polymerase-interacting CarD/CdnL/TRCF family regulator
LNTILKDKNYLQTAFENLKKDIETVNNLTKSEIISKLRNRLDSKNNAEYILSNLKNPTEDIIS